MADEIAKVANANRRLAAYVGVPRVWRGFLGKLWFILLKILCKLLTLGCVRSLGTWNSLILASSTGCCCWNEQKFIV